MKREQNHLPVFGVGPLYVIIIIFFTLVGLLLDYKDFFNGFKLINFKIIFIIFGVLIFFEGLIIFVNAVIVSKINRKIVNNELVTTGVYRYVRNPIYSSFLMICSSLLLFTFNFLLLILPIFYWIFLTILMKQTEEKWLKSQFGQEYLDYCKRTNRCIAFFPKNITGQ